MSQALSRCYIPTEDDIISLKPLFAKSLSRLANIEHEIRIAERWIHHLKHDRDTILQSFEKYDYFVRRTPRHLPDDILREIFMWCLPRGRNPTTSFVEAPLLFTRVSSQWRNVALTTPRLWSALHIAVPNSIPLHSAYDPTTGNKIPPSYFVSRRLRGVSEWLERSGQLPLSLSLHDPNTTSDSGFGKLFVQAILPYASRWQHLSIQCPPDVAAEISPLGPSYVPLLESLHILPTPRSLNWRDSGLIRAPRLHDVSIHGLLEGFMDLPLVWDRMTHLSLMGGQWLDGSLTMAQIGLILTRCTRLETCTLKLTGGASLSRERRELPPILLPNLHKLCIHEMQAQTPLFFAAINAPVLRELEYWFDGNNKCGPSGFSALLANVGTSLKTLSTNPASLDPTELLKGLWSCTAINTLVLRASPHNNSITYSESQTNPTSDPLLHSFTYPTEGRYLCPQLETFECLVNSNYSSSAVLEFITRKQEGVDSRINKLKCVKIFMQQGPAMDFATLLKPHISKGLSVDIRYPPSSYMESFSPYEGLDLVGDCDPYYQPRQSTY